MQRDRPVNDNRRALFTIDQGAEIPIGGKIGDFGS
jgi:hypothetical protein